MIAITLMIVCPAAFANNTADTQTKVIEGILSIIYLIISVVGALFVVLGIVKLIIAHAQEDSPAQEKAAMFIASGIVLLLAQVVIKGLNIEDWIYSISETGSTTTAK